MRDYKERVLWGGDATFGAKLDTGFGEFEGIGYCCFDAAGYAPGEERYDWR